MQALSFFTGPCKYETYATFGDSYMTIGRMKRSIFIYFIAVVFIGGCKTDSSTLSYEKITGQTMGTYYAITATVKDPAATQQAIEVLLSEINAGVNNYLPNSLITNFNNSETGGDYDISTIEGQHFYENIAASRRVVKETNNHFDPTVGPLVNYWRFGPDGKYNLTAIDSTKVDLLMQVVSFNRVILKKGSNNFRIDKSDPRVKLDFSAIAKGYGVDKVAELLENKGVENYFVDIGGENKLKGVNDKGMPWVLGINTPKADAGIKEFSKIISITDKAIATSGNYRQVYEVDGVKLSHTINPFTGYPERSNLLSATIIHDQCMYADAYATACMVMGLEKALQFVNTHPEISYLFLYSNENGEIDAVASEGLNFL